MLDVQVPAQMLCCPTSHRHYLSDRIIWLDLGPKYHNEVVQRIAPVALSMAAGPSGVTGYSMVVNLLFYQIDILEMSGGEFDLGAPRSTAMDKLIKNGNFVASKTDDQDLGMCGICLEDFSSSVGNGQLLRMNCSHFYHQSCVLPWLVKYNTCPTCRRQNRLMFFFLFV